MSEEEISVVHPTKRELDAVFAIYRQHKKQLGFLPDSAFIERWQKKHLLVVKLNRTIAGYVLFSVNRRREVRVAHLAVDEAFQGKRLSKFLIDRLKQDYADHTRIRLNCRADYKAAKI